MDEKDQGTRQPRNEPSRKSPSKTRCKTSYLDYSMSVIIGRAIPDIRDGLKPVHRRSPFSMHQTGSHYNQPYKKSARIVGDVMGKYHPHGDAAIYDTIVRMAQDFSLRYPLVDGQGNFGSIDGDPPAAMRYTEARLQKITNEMLNDLDKDTVDFVPNYDGSLTEPAIFPSLLPTLLLNGTSGIAVGMATSIPPHNLGELVDAFIHYVDNRDASVGELMKIMPGPDFPTGGFIFGQNMIQAAYETGKGSFVVRAKAVIETDTKGRQKIVVTEIPYQTNKSKILENIAELVKNKRIEGISDLRDESDRDGMRIVIEIKKDEIPEVILNTLFKHTQLQTSYSIILLAIVNQQPKQFNLIEYFNYFLGHRKEIIRRRSLFELDKAEKRAHIIEGLKIALGKLDLVIKIIRGSKNRVEAKAGLIEKTQADRGPGRRHSRYAALPADRAGDRKAGERIYRPDQADQLPQGTAGQRAHGAEPDQGGTAQGQGAVRRQAPHRDRRKTTVRVQDRRHDQGRGFRHFLYPQRLYQAHHPQLLPQHEPRHHGQERRRAEGRGRHFPGVRRFRPRLHPGFHRERTHVLDQGL